MQIEQFDEAKSNLNRAVDIFVVMNDVENLLVANAYYNLGEIADKEGVLHEAIAFMEKALTIRKEKLGETHRSTQATLNRLQEIIKKRAS